MELIEYIDKANEKFLFRKPPQNILVAEVLANLNGEAFSVSPEPLDQDRDLLLSVFGKIKDSVSTGIDNISLLDLTSSMGKDEKPSQLVELVKDQSETA